MIPMPFLAIVSVNYLWYHLLISTIEEVINMTHYYYCSLNTFINIIKNKQLFLSDPLKMNDYMEAEWGLNQLLSSPHYQQMMDRAQLDFSKEEIKNAFSALKKNDSKTYICCFSGDGDLLSQWRAYGDDGHGLSIGFDLSKMIGEYYNIFPYDIKYLHNPDEIAADADSAYSFEFLADTVPTSFDGFGITKREDKLTYFVRELFSLLLKYKNPAFCEEKETRIVYDAGPKFEDIVQKNNAWQTKMISFNPPCDFRTSGNSKIVKYYKLDFKPDCVTDIFIGPLSELSEYDVKELLTHYWDDAIDVHIHQSAASYR